MSATERRRGGGAPDLGAWIIPALAVVYFAAWGALYVGLSATGGVPPIPDNNRIGLPIYVATGQVPISTGGLIVAVIALMLVVAGITTPVGWLLLRRKPNRHVDAAAVHMARGKELGRLSKAHAVQLAQELGVACAAFGVLIGVTIAGRTPLWADWESTEVDIWGPRTGKSSSRAIPVILDAPGAVVATSNRRDLVDATRIPRSQAGTVRVFDPQQIVGEAPTFYWDPLTYILSGPADPVVKARSLAGIFAAATTHPDAKSDKFFDPKGEALLGHLMLAAALDGKGLPDVYRWVNRETDDTPARILAARGYQAAADSVFGVIHSPDKQRGGIYATAELCINWMTNPSAVEWITPKPGKPTIDAAAFARSTDTLYLVSREGRGSLGALTAALTAAVCEAAEHVASRSPRGRLPVPMVVCLDEVANVCRWPDLPDLYSHYGGRGIYLLAILQSWRQGEDCWGPRGMSKLWSAATVRIYGGGDVEVHFLDELRRLVGSYRPEQVSTGHGRSGRSVNYSEGSDDILDIADLAALPRGRQVLIASGARPTLISCTPWWEGPWEDAVKASIAAHDPGAARTLAEVPA